MSGTAPEGSLEPRSATVWGWRLWVALGVAGLVLAGGAAVLVAAAHVQADTPRLAVAQYLTALKEGDAKKALALGDIRRGAGDVLLADQAYAHATKRITSFRVGAPVVTGDIATVRATISQGTHRYGQAFHLHRVGHSPIAFDVWKLEPVPLTRVGIAFSGPEGIPFTIAGRPIHSESDLELRALPGTYNVLIAGDASTMFYTAPFTVTAIGFGTAAPTLADVAIDLSQDGDHAARAAVESFLDGCAASTELAPAGCPFAAFSNAGTIVDSAQWAIDTRPDVQIGTFQDGGWPVDSTVPGSARLSGTAHDAAGDSGDVSTPDIPFGLTGTVTFSGDTATYSELLQ